MLRWLTSSPSPVRAEPSTMLAETEIADRRICDIQTKSFIRWQDVAPAIDRDNERIGLSKRSQLSVIAHGCRRQQRPCRVRHRDRPEA